MFTLFIWVSGNTIGRASYLEVIASLDGLMSHTNIHLDPYPPMRTVHTAHVYIVHVQYMYLSLLGNDNAQLTMMQDVYKMA